MSSGQLDFTFLRSEDSTIDDVGVIIIDKFEAAVSSGSEHNVEEQAIHLVADLFAYKPEEPSSFGGTTMRVFLEIAARTPVNHYGQEILIRVMSMLEHCGPWKKLPDLEMFLRDRWNHSPTFELETDDDQQFTQDEWLNLNSFAARLFNLNGQRFGRFALWEIRNGLEEDAHDFGFREPFHARIRIALEWIERSDSQLWHESCLGTFSDEPDVASRGDPYGGGRLFSGSKGFTLERWGFWKRRLAEVRSDCDESLRERIDDAVQAMTAIERKHGLRAESA